jgi:predicted enzyme related to lactoylglutathione lyase
MNATTQTTDTRPVEHEGELKLGCVTILVRDYDEALRFYTEALGFEKRMDQKMGPSARWVTVASKGQDVQIALQKPEPSMHGEARAKEMTERIGQAPTGVLVTNDCKKTYETLLARGVKFSSPPSQQPWGVQAVLQDLYGNSYALVERPSRKS